MKVHYHYPQNQSHSEINLYYSAAFPQSFKLKMFRSIPPESNVSALFYVE